MISNTSGGWNPMQPHITHCDASETRAKPFFSTTKTAAHLDSRRVVQFRPLEDLTFFHRVSSIALESVYADSYGTMCERPIIMLCNT